VMLFDLSEEGNFEVLVGAWASILADRDCGDRRHRIQNHRSDFAEENSWAAQISGRSKRFGRFLSRVGRIDLDCNLLPHGE